MGEVGSSVHLPLLKPRSCKEVPGKADSQGLVMFQYQPQDTLPIRPVRETLRKRLGIQFSLSEHRSREEQTPRRLLRILKCRKELQAAGTEEEADEK